MTGRWASASALCVSGFHEWQPVGSEIVSQWEELDPEAVKRSREHGNSLMAMPAKPKTYIIRACRLCSEVWWQEYDLATVRRGA